MGDLPLSGVRVLDFTWVWSGPFCTLQLAHLGAEVIRVESARRMCSSRANPPFADNIPGLNRAGFFNQYSQGKRSITLNLSLPEGVDIVRRLVRISDVVAQSFAVGVIERLGLGYDDLRAIRPDIIMISLSGFGQSGPYRSYIGYGPLAGALAGFFTTTGYEGAGPSDIGIAYADPNAGMFAAHAVVMALLHRMRTGDGQHIDLSQWEAALTVMGEGLLEYAMTGRTPKRVGNHDGQMSPHNTFKASPADQDKWVSIAVGSDAEWRALCNCMGQPELATDPRFETAELRKLNEATLEEIISAWTAQRDRWEITKQLQRAGVGAFPSLSNKDLAEDPHLRRRGYLVQLDHREVGQRLHAGVPWKMSLTPCYVRKPAPLLGADTDSVLKDLLGMSQDEVERLRAANVLS